MFNHIVADIDLTALKHNFSVAKQAAPHSNVMAVIKANAYGHGMIQIARALPNVDAFAVARVSEGVELRNAGIKQAIVVLAGFNGKEELAQCSHYDLDIVVHSMEQVECVEQSDGNAPLTTWLKINTGMNRLGFSPEAFASALNRLTLNQRIRQPIKCMTHLACADDTQSKTTEQQISLFDDLVGECGGEQSIANSAGLLAWGYAQRHWVRPGIMLYGGNPFCDRTAADDGLKPVMTLKSHVLAIRHIKKGQRVGYGGTWEAEKSSLIATIGVGYGDGYPRHAKQGTPVLINGQTAKLVGRVSMDSITVDVTHLKGIDVGDSAVLWGHGLPIEVVAEASGTISYDLMCAVTERVPRRFIGCSNGR